MICDYTTKEGKEISVNLDQIEWVEWIEVKGGEADEETAVIHMVSGNFFELPSEEADQLSEDMATYNGEDPIQSEEGIGNGSQAN